MQKIFLKNEKIGHQSGKTLKIIHLIKDLYLEYIKTIQESIIENTLI